MATALIDSNVLIAFASQRDEHHASSDAILTGIDRGELPSGRLTNYVVAETLGYLNERAHHQTAVDLYERLKAGSVFEVVHCTTQDFATAESIFEQYSRISFVDATIVAHARRIGIEYVYSFDGDLDGFDGITRLDTASDPYQ